MIIILLFVSLSEINILDNHGQGINIIVYNKEVHLSSS